MTNRYMKGRLPEGVDFAAYPGRSSTPLPTAESKSAERINQLKIWNEAATNDDKRRLNAQKAKGVSMTGSTASTRRTDSYKDAKDRHSASFHGAPPPPVESTMSHTSGRTTGAGLPSKSDMFADRSDSESEDDDLPDSTPLVPVAPTHQVASQELPSEPLRDELHVQNADADQGPRAAPMAYVPSKPVEDLPQASHPRNEPTSTRHDNAPAQPPPKEAKGCCVIM